MDYEYITDEFEDWLKARKTKIADRCLKALNREIALVVKDDYNIYLEQVVSYIPIPNYLYNQFKLFKKGG